MRTAAKCTIYVLTLAMMVAALIAQEPAAPPLERKDIDQQLSNALRDVINRGREHYNNGNPAACYFIFAGALQTSLPLLDNRPELQKSLQNSLVQADAHPDMRQRAWMLRGVLDKVRSELKGEAVAGAAKPGEKQPAAEEKKPAPEPIEKKPAAVDTQESLLKGMLGTLKSVIPVLKTVEDEATAKAALPKLKKDASQMADIKKRMDKLGEPTKEEQEQLMKKFGDEMTIFKTFGDELERLSKVQGAEEILKQFEEKK
jgi:hypothetical protein